MDEEQDGKTPEPGEFDWMGELKTPDSENKLSEEAPGTGTPGTPEEKLPDPAKTPEGVLGTGTPGTPETPGDESLDAQGILEKYGNDPAKLAAAYKSLELRLSQQGQELGDLRKQAQAPTQETQQKQEVQKGEYGHPIVDGVEQIPETYWLGPRLRDSLAWFSEIGNLETYYKNEGYSPEDAAEYAQQALDTDSYKDLARSYVISERDQWAESARQAKESSSASEAAAFERDRPALESAQREIAHTLRENAARLLGVSYDKAAPPEAMSESMKVLHGTALAYLTELYNTGQISLRDAYSAKSARDAYGYAMQALLDNPDFIEVVNRDRAGKPAVVMPSSQQSQNSAADGIKPRSQAPVVMSGSLSADQRDVYEVLKGLNPELTEAQLLKDLEG